MTSTPLPLKDHFIFGIHAITEAIITGQSISKIFLAPQAKGARKTLMQLAKEYVIPVSQAPISKLKRITAGNHQGAIALISPIHFADLNSCIATAYEAGRMPLIVVLDGIEDVRNWGAIARSAEAAGADGLLVAVHHSALINAAAVKASAGAALHLPICRTQQLNKSLIEMQQSGLQLMGCSEKAEKLIYSADLTSAVALIFGNEQHGISTTTLQLIDQLIKLPMKGRINSLNVGAAVASTLYEVTRQRLLL